ncbi:nuclear transport factor 2 family protein [Gilvimarinus sp. SDUM040013]|uniref:Nuclear transport factor 2 family protein n=1 Tax=Gilvimarinus gilvus TaxID=3058038 RepID=A0ABU4S4B6_9GAMM|nr:nuclear transport factor 2 family protein [Gilvimarinus sp. SDUM040013]MDO3388040.1 nuclear transport factor 2 family protein [Gilvimarinus sp. SDUM040013]MDX6851421.1 nuclear transport factor 2 family protein [Gilvimarinus sp. SDUM040013]
MSKLSILSIVLLISLFQVLPASADDLDGVLGAGPRSERLAVLETLKTYLKVTDEKENAAIRKSFHPTAHLMSVSKKGSLRSLTQDFWWERVSQIPDDHPGRTSKFRIIDVSGHAAMARIDIKNAGTGSISTDYLNLQKVDSGWRIVNKTLSTPL